MKSERTKFHRVLSKQEQSSNLSVEADDSDNLVSK